MLQCSCKKGQFDIINKKEDEKLLDHPPITGNNEQHRFTESETSNILYSDVGMRKMGANY